MAGSSVERKRKRKKLHRDSSESEGGADSGSDAEWNDEDNDAYLDFLQDFLFPGQSKNNGEVNDDDEADPEYNVKEDEEEHDKEELRRDPAVKISKKELIELLAELGSDESVFHTVPKQGSDSNKATNVTLQEQQQQQLEKSSHNTHESVEARVEVIPQVVVEEKEEPVITETVRSQIQYQLQQHVQLLAQTYALTVISTRDEDRTLARESKKMIIELHSFASSYGPQTTFRVKNIHHAANLVNSWPAPVVSKSPIKKKILEERYRSQQRQIYGGNGLLFSREVVKKIADCPAFMYAQLLPVYPHLHSEYKITFSPSEDALIAIGYREMKDKSYDGLKTKRKAKVIADILLPGRSALQIFHRIKNARKMSSANEQNNGLKVLRKYLLEGVQPPSPLESWSPELMKVEAIPPVKQAELPPTWVSLLQKLNLEIFDEAAATTIVKRPRSKKMSKIELVEGDGKPKTTPGNRSKSLTPLHENKLSGTGLITHDIQPSVEASEETERIPLFDQSGNAAAFVVIPKKYLGKPAGDTVYKDASSNNNSEAIAASNVISATPIGEPFKLPESFQDENVREKSSVIDLQTIDSPLKREIFQMATSSTETSSQPQKLPARRIRNKTTDETCKRRKRARKSVDNLNQPASEKSAESFSQSDQSLNCSKSCREDHSARTWIYQRKSEEEVRATIERKLNTKKSRSKRAGTGSNAPDKDVKVSASSDDDEPALLPVGPSFNSRCGIIGMSVPSLEAEGAPGSAPNEALGLEKEPNEQSDEPVDTGDQRADSTSQGGEKNSSKSTTTSAVRPNRGTKRDRSSKQGAGEGGDGDDEPPERHRPLGTKPDGDADHREEDTEDENEDKESPDSSSAVKAVAKNVNVSKKSESSTRNPKKFKRSPQTKKRISKYKTEQIQKLLDEADSEVNIEEIEKAFAEEFWAKCQHTLDPVMYNNLVQIFCDFGEKNTNEDEVFTKVEEMLKDHPDLLIDLATMIEPQLLQKNNLLKDNYVIQAYIRFMHLLEKITLQCPQLRARVLQKLRVLRDLEKVTEEDVLELVDLYFQGNPIMTDALKAMFPSIFPPQSTIRSEDFEEINFDDDNLTQCEEGMAIETVILPEETAVPATSTCPCDCHSDAQNVTYHTKVRHCRKCCIKFQDGKVFMNSGRFMKQVNIEYTSREKAEEILAGIACGHCFESLKAAPKIKSPKKLPKKRFARPRVNVSECESETEVKPSPSFSGGLPKPTAPAGAKLEIWTPSVAPADISTVAPSTKMAPPLEIEDLEEGEIVDEEDSPISSTKETKPKVVAPTTTESSKSVTPLSSTAVNTKSSKFPSEQTMNKKVWTYDEDKVLLQTCQQEGPSVSTFEKIVRSKSLLGRTVEEIQDRFNELVRMIQKIQDQEKKACK